MRCYLFLDQRDCLIGYQSSNFDTQDLQVKAHNVRSMSASLVFKDGCP